MAAPSRNYGLEPYTSESMVFVFGKQPAVNCWNMKGEAIDWALTLVIDRDLTLEGRNLPSGETSAHRASPIERILQIPS